jgi:putative CocE/NonD family hydrolase
MSAQGGPFGVAVERDVATRTRDGAALISDVYRPDSSGAFPVLVRRTPYGKRENDLATEFSEAHFFASHGYLVVVQDTRGRWASEGEFYPFIHEGEDGFDTIEWAAGLDGSTGDVGTFGQSYGALCQYLTAPLRPPHLRTAVPVSGPVTYFQNFVFRNGVFELGWMLSYVISMSRDTLQRKGRADEISRLDSYVDNPKIRFSPLTDQQYRHLPLADWADRLAVAAPYFADILHHWTDGPYWWAIDVRRQLHNIDVPMLHVSSWYDGFQYDTLTMYRGIAEAGLSERTRRGQALLMGPWAHLLPYSAPTSGGTGDVDFGAAAAISLLDIELRWFDRFLKASPGDRRDDQHVRIFVMGVNRWRDEREWPLDRAVHTPCYLHSGGGAKGLDGDGTLDWEPPGDETPDRYTYDPQDPVVTRGGHFIGLGAGVADQRPTEARQDVLVYTGAPLESDLEITGPIVVRLFASSSAPNTDFVATLVDVRPDGYAQNLAEGVVRTCFRDSSMYPTMSEPGSICEYSIDLWSISHVLFAGHRIRVHLSSSDFPRWDRNANSGMPFGADSDTKVADQTVFHDSAHPSHIVLPVIPAS